MSKKHQQQNREEQQSQEGVIASADQSAEHEAQSTDPIEQHEPQEGGDQPATDDAQSATDDAPATEVVKPMVMGIGQMARHLIKNSTKTNSEILELILKVFPGSKTTPACIAWYKTDMRKKGLLEGGVTRGRAKTIELSAEELEALTK